MARAPQRRIAPKPTKRRERSASERGYDWQWSKPNGTAAQARERDGWMCVKCVEEGGYVAAVESMTERELIVDHIVPAHICGQAKFHDLDNLQTLCPSHHAAKTLEDLKKYGAARR